MPLPLRYYGHPDLRTKAKPIEKITPAIVELAQQMIEKMIESNGVGIAGPQVGKLLRIFIIRDEKLNANNEYEMTEPEVIINPILTAPSSGGTAMEEGCLSLPGIHVEVTRPSKIHVQYQNLKGETLEEDFTDFRARVLMHENDHLNGVLIIDRMDPKLRQRIDPMLREIKKKHAK